MATRQDFTDEEWATLQKGLGGSGALVSVSDRDFTDTFGEASALAKYLAGQQVAATSELMRELAKTRGTGFGLTTSPDRMRTETLAALSSAVGMLGAKAPRTSDRTGSWSSAWPRPSPTRRVARRRSRRR